MRYQVKIFVGFGPTLQEVSLREEERGGGDEQGRRELQIRQQHRLSGDQQEAEGAQGRSSSKFLERRSYPDTMIMDFWSLGMQKNTFLVW